MPWPWVIELLSAAVFTPRRLFTSFALAQGHCGERMDDSLRLSALTPRMAISLVLTWHLRIYLRPPAALENEAAIPAWPVDYVTGRPWRPAIIIIIREGTAVMTLHQWVYIDLSVYEPRPAFDSVCGMLCSHAHKETWLFMSLNE